MINHLNKFRFMKLFLLIIAIFIAPFCALSQIDIITQSQEKQDDIKPYDGLHNYGSSSGQNLIGEELILVGDDEYISKNIRLKPDWRYSPPTRAINLQNKTFKIIGINSKYPSTMLKIANENDTLYIEYEEIGYSSNYVLLKHLNFLKNDIGKKYRFIKASSTDFYDLNTRDQMTKIGKTIYQLSDIVISKDAVGSNTERYKLFYLLKDKNNRSVLLSVKSIALKEFEIFEDLDSVIENLNSEIRSDSSKPKINNTKKSKEMYDSLTNDGGGGYKGALKMKGQEIFFWLSEQDIKYSTQIIPKDKKSLIFKNRRFTITDVIIPENGSSLDYNDYILEISNENGSLMIAPNSSFASHSSNIVIGYLKKLRESIGNKFYLLYENNGKDYYTNAPLNIERGTIWELIDIVVKNKYEKLCFLYRDKDGQVMSTDEGSIRNSNKFEKYSIIEKYRRKYGNTHLNKALKHGTICIGMHKDLLVLAYGYPKSINRSSYGDDQYVYSGQYVYVNKKGYITGWN